MYSRLGPSCKKLNQYQVPSWPDAVFEGFEYVSLRSQDMRFYNSPSQTKMLMESHARCAFVSVPGLHVSLIVLVDPIHFYYFVLHVFGMRLNTLKLNSRSKASLVIISQIL